MSARQSAENGAPLTDVPFIKAPMPDRRDFPLDTAEKDRTPHTHGGTDAPECTTYGLKCPSVIPPATTEGSGA